MVSISFFLKNKIQVCIVLIIVSVLALTGCNTGTMQQEHIPGQKSQVVTIKMLDIGQGDSILIRTSEQVIMIDTGDVDERERLMSLLKNEGITTIDKLIITHPHADHIGGAYILFKQFNVKAVYDNGQITNTKTYQTYLKWIKDKNIAYKQLLAGDQLTFGGGVSFKVFSPTAQMIKADGDLNADSIVGKLIYGDFSMLFTGDSEADTEKNMLKKYGTELKSTVLKVPHHGSKTSSNRNYLKAVAPEAGLISLGAGNDYGHPHQETLNTYNTLHIKLYRTDQDGSITVTTDGKTYNIQKEK